MAFPHIYPLYFTAKLLISLSDLKLYYLINRLSRPYMPIIFNYIETLGCLFIHAIDFPIVFICAVWYRPMVRGRRQGTWHHNHHHWLCRLPHISTKIWPKKGGRNMPYNWIINTVILWSISTETHAMHRPNCSFTPSHAICTARASLPKTIIDSIDAP